MSINQCSLNQIPMGQRCKITQLNSNGLIRTRLQDIGLIEGTELTPIFRSCANDPVAYLVRGTLIALRNQDCQSILVQWEEE